METQKLQKPDIMNTKKSLELIKIALNKSMKSGTYDNIEEPYLVRVAFTNIEQALAYYLNEPNTESKK